VPMIFVNLPVRDLVASRAFYTALGFSINEFSSDDRTVSVVVDDTIVVALHTRDRFAELVAGEVGDPAQATSVVSTLTLDSPVEVDHLAAKATAAGARPWLPPLGRRCRIRKELRRPRRERLAGRPPVGPTRYRLRRPAGAASTTETRHLEEPCSTAYSPRTACEPIRRGSPCRSRCRSTAVSGCRPSRRSASPSTGMTCPRTTCPSRWVARGTPSTSCPTRATPCGTSRSIRSSCFGTTHRSSSESATTSGSPGSCGCPPCRSLLGLTAGRAYTSPTSSARPCPSWRPTAPRRHQRSSRMSPRPSPTDQDPFKQVGSFVGER